ncbi:uncharacterized protein LOC114283684 [Camellia sinensis]|uniref:uncharacterized protein LOC114283684 n=1 Tax=Camellia sinensis TaxID=4442 RepID=UPI001036B126|nr:uncharacterized protein LOC114283684 [Camellia sinensis]
MDFLGVDSDGSACGLLCIWRPEVFKLRDCCCSKNFILLLGASCLSFECVIVNIYAPNEIVGRRKLWEVLVNVHPHYPNPWCVGRGDFNEIRFINERRGCSRRERGMQDFNDLIVKLELTNQPLLSKQFTWCNALDEERWSKIDRFLLDSRWLEKFSFKRWGLLRPLSDHCPILLKEDERDWGPKPFKFLNPWLSHPTFMPGVKQIWENNQVSKWARFKLMRKLNDLRSHLSVWNKAVFGNIDSLLKSAEEELHDWDLKAESGSLDDEAIRRRREARSLVWKLSRDKERLWHQKSIMLWAQNGDKSTRFFHIMASRRQSKNLLDSVCVEGVCFEDPAQIKQAVVRHFRKQFMEN